MKFILAIFVIILLITPASALDITAPTVPEEAADFMPQDSSDFPQGLWELAQQALTAIVPHLKEAGLICGKILVIILLISDVLRQFQHVDAVRYAFLGIRAGVLALIVKAFWGMFKKCKKGTFAYAVMLAVFACVVFWDVSVVLLLVRCALLGLGITMWKGRGAK